MSNSKTLVLVGAAIIVYYYINRVKDDNPDFRKMDSENVSQYRVGAYARSYGSVPYNPPRTEGNFFQLFFGSDNSLGGIRHNIDLQRQKTEINPNRRDTNMIKF